MASGWTGAIPVKDVGAQADAFACIQILARRLKTKHRKDVGSPIETGKTNTVPCSLFQPFVKRERENQRSRATNISVEEGRLDHGGQFDTRAEKRL